jgi:hypothetical protein
VFLNKLGGWTTSKKFVTLTIHNCHKPSGLWENNIYDIFKITPNIIVEWLLLMLCIQCVLVSNPGNLGPETDYCD